MTVSRRSLLAGMGATLALPQVSLAFGDQSQVGIAELNLGQGTTSRPNSWKRLLFEVVHTTSVECNTTDVLVSPEDEALFEHPFAVVLGDGAFEQPSEKGLEQLSRYLAYGGFLLFDDISGTTTGGGFDRSVRRLCNSLFPTRPLAPLPEGHSIFRAFFLLDKPLGRVANHRYLEGITMGNVSPVIYTRNDLSGALERDSSGRHPYPCVPGGEMQRREAVKLGINLILYSLTANYKQDQAHVKQLILEGRLD